MLVIADYFVEDIRGGGELCTEEVIKHLQKSQPNIRKVRSHLVTPQIIEEYSGKPILISNFINLSEEIKNKLSSEGFFYFIIEHDHKYCASRNPLTYSGMIVPEEQLRHKSFYAGARAVLCQSESHKQLLQKNLWIENVINLGTNLWSDEDLDSLEKRVITNRRKVRKLGIMDSGNPIKGTKQAVELCQTKGLEFELIPALSQQLFWDELSLTDTLVFLPQTFETYSRVAIEAKILGCKLVTNKAIGAMSEPYWNQSGQELLNTIRNNKKEVLSLIQDLIEDFKYQMWTHWKPRVSLITTVYKGSKYLKGFLDAFVSQENRRHHELIIIDANSPENEEEIIKPYLEKHGNIKYEKIATKKTTMECFNIATDRAEGEYVCLCMVDDRIAPDYIDVCSKQLTLRPDIDLVYGDAAVTVKANDTFKPGWQKLPKHEHSLQHFTREGMIKNLPGPFPMYRKSLHYKIGGYRSEILHAGDWEFYLRAVQKGSLFLKINYVAGLYYNNPDGLSTTRDHVIEKERRGTEQMIFEEYKDIFGSKVYQQFKSYFDQWKL